MLKKVSKYDGEKLTTYLIFLNYIITYFLLEKLTKFLIIFS